MDINLNDILSKIDIPADWLSLREVKETTTYRVIRDGNPQGNMQKFSRGIMIEVLADGQFGYYGSRNLDVQSIQNGAEKALCQARAASKNPIFNFSDDVRPMTKGMFSSPYLKSVDTVDPGRLNEILLRAYNELKINDKIVSASAMGMIIETECSYVSSNGSDVKQNFSVRLFCHS